MVYYTKALFVTYFLTSCIVGFTLQASLAPNYSIELVNPDQKSIKLSQPLVELCTTLKNLRQDTDLDRVELPLGTYKALCYFKRVLKKFMLLKQEKLSLDNFISWLDLAAFRNKLQACMLSEYLDVDSLPNLCAHAVAQHLSNPEYLHQLRCNQAAYSIVGTLSSDPLRVLVAQSIISHNKESLYPFLNKLITKRELERTQLTAYETCSLLVKPRLSPALNKKKHRLAKDTYDKVAYNNTANAVIGATSNTLSLATFPDYTLQATWTISEGERILALSFSPDNKLVAAVSEQCMLYVWDISRKSTVVPLCSYQFMSADGSEPLAPFVDFKASGLEVLCATCRGKVYSYNLKLGLCQEVIDQGAPLGQCTYNAQHTLVLTTSDDSIVKLWDIKTGTLEREFSVPYAIKKVIFSRNGEYILISDLNKPACLWDTWTGECVASLGSKSMGDIAFNDTGDMLVFSSRKGRKQRFDIGALKQLLTHDNLLEYMLFLIMFAQTHQVHIRKEKHHVKAIYESWPQESKKMLDKFLHINSR